MSIPTECLAAHSPELIVAELLGYTVGSSGAEAPNLPTKTVRTFSFIKFIKCIVPRCEYWVNHFGNRRQARRVHQSLWMRFSLGEWPIDVSCLLKIHMIQNICRFYIFTKPLKVHGRRHNQALKYWPSRIMYSQVFMPLLCLEIFWVGCRRLIQLDKAVMADLQRRLGPLETVPHRASSLMVPVSLGFVAWQNSFVEPMEQTPMEQLPLFVDEFWLILCCVKIYYGF